MLYLEEIRCTEISFLSSYLKVLSATTYPTLSCVGTTVPKNRYATNGPRNDATCSNIPYQGLQPSPPPLQTLPCIDSSKQRNGTQTLKSSIGPRNHRPPTTRCPKERQSPKVFGRFSVPPRVVRRLLVGRSISMRREQSLTRIFSWMRCQQLGRRQQLRPQRRPRILLKF